MEQIPTWLGAIGVLFVIAAALGAAVAVYRTNLQATSLREAERTIERLRGDITDYERREDAFEHRLEVAEVQNRACADRVHVLEDLVLRRSDDEALRAEIAAVRQVVDDNVLSQLTSIHALLVDHGPSHA